MRNICRIKKYTYLCTVLKKQRLLKTNMVNVAQLVRALDCGSKGRGFESHLSPRRRRGSFKINMVNVAQLVRALDCGSKGRGFEPHLSPCNKKDLQPKILFFVCISLPAFCCLPLSFLNFPLFARAVIRFIWLIHPLFLILALIMKIDKY